MTNFIIRLSILALLLGGSIYAEPPSFKNDVMPIFMRGGCNGGACHGSARGKDGFKLSLFGYDPDGDYFRLLEEYVGRRINMAVPEQSLLLEKAAGKVPHTGGQIFTPDTEYYQTIRDWIAAGAPFDADDAPRPVQLQIKPDKLTFDKPGVSEKTEVIARYSDGTSRDVSHLALYMTNNESIATISKSAEVSALQPGGTHVFARFERFTVGAEIVVLPSGDFEPPPTPTNNYIDPLVFDKLNELRILPAELCSDDQFIRRVCIDLIGSLPTPEQFDRFINDTADDKRTKLVDDLLGRQEFGELWAAQWGEWLRISTDTNPEAGTAMKAGWNYYQWLREQLVNNRPWDQIANELLTGNGSNLRNPPSNYYTMLPQGRLEPKKLGEDTAQIFLGIRTQCAQCHNHPFDQWTIDDYYSFTSFFTGLRRKHGSEAREFYTFVDVDAEPALHLVDNRPMPHKFLGGDIADVKNKDPRKVLSAWMTASDNTFFRRNLANRIWAHFFGRGIVHPIDDVRVSNPPSNEPLLAELGRRLAVDYQFNAKRLVRDICLSRTYQLSPTTNASNRGDESRFSHAYLRRMRSDVLFDCLCQALDTKRRFRRSTADRATLMFEGGSRDDFNAYFFQTFGQTKRESVCTCETNSDASLSQALHLMNGKTIDDAFRGEAKLVRRLANEAESIEAGVRSLFIRMFSRQPSSEELSRILALAPEQSDKSRHQAFYQNVAWALLNSSEFMFNH